MRRWLSACVIAAVIVCGASSALALSHCAFADEAHSEASRTDMPRIDLGVVVANEAHLRENIRKSLFPKIGLIRELPAYRDGTLSGVKDLLRVQRHGTTGEKHIGSDYDFLVGSGSDFFNIDLALAGKRKCHSNLTFESRGCSGVFKVPEQMKAEENIIIVMGELKNLLVPSQPRAQLVLAGVPGDTVGLAHGLSGLAGIFHSLQSGVQSALHKPDTNACDDDRSDRGDEHQQRIKRHILLGLQIGLSALLFILGCWVCSYGFNRGRVADLGCPRFIYAGVGLTLIGGTVASASLVLGILLLR